MLYIKTLSQMTMWCHKIPEQVEGSRWHNELVVGLPNNSYKPITNTAWVRTRLCKLQKRVYSTRSRKW